MSFQQKYGYPPDEFNPRLKAALRRWRHAKLHEKRQATAEQRQRVVNQQARIDAWAAVFPCCGDVHHV